MKSALIQIDNLTKTYQGFKALDDFSVQIPQASIYGLLGPNGAGKTTLIRILNQIIYADNGTILFNGHPLNAEDVSQIGYLPEERGLYRNMKIGEQLVYLATLKGMSVEQAKAQLSFWFEKFQIQSWIDKKVSGLSKGMAQKVQFISTVLHRPKLLILDEPFSGFDPVNAEVIKNEIIELKNNGTTVILSTHRMESVQELCDRICLIHQSKKILEGEVHDLQQQAKDRVYHIRLRINENRPALEEFITSCEAIFDVNFTGENQVDLKLNYADQDADAILKDLLSTSSLLHLEDQIPSVQELFVRNIKKHGY